MGRPVVDVVEQLVKRLHDTAAAATAAPVHTCCTRSQVCATGLAAAVPGGWRAVGAHLWEERLVVLVVDGVWCHKQNEDVFHTQSVLRVQQRVLYREQGGERSGCVGGQVCRMQTFRQENRVHLPPPAGNQVFFLIMLTKCLTCVG